jgi:hypothetical protein
MDRRQMNVSEMLLTLEEFLTTNLFNFQNKPAIMAVIEKLKTKNAEIRVLNQSQSVSTEADFAIKGEDEDTLIATAVKVSDGLKVIAASTNDTRLKIEAKISQWDLKRMRKDARYVRLKQLYTTALPFVGQLVPMGITQLEVESLDTESTKLLKVKPVINNIKVKTTQATADLGQAIEDIKTLVKETLDPLMLEFKLLNPTLYGEYLNARKVNNRAAGHEKKQADQK